MRLKTSAMRHYAQLTTIFFLLVVLLPANRATMAQYHLSSMQYHVLLFLVELPLAAIWFAAFFSYAKLEQYAIAIKDTREGKGFERLAVGGKWLAWGLPIPALLGLLLSALANSHSGFQPTSVIIANYAGLLFPLVAFWFMSEGGRELVTKTKLQLSATTTKNIQFLYVAVGVIYCYLIFRQLDLRSLSGHHNPFFLPVWLLVLTVIIPYLYAWFMGLLAAYDILLLARHAHGVLYRQALRLVASGLSVVVASLIAVQYLRLAIPRSGRLSLSLALLTIYLIYLMTAFGFALIALGANRLKKIEEV